MEKTFNYLYQTCLKTTVTVCMLFFFGWQVSAQTITTTDCDNTYSYCSQDSVTLAPANTTDYTNFTWYGNSVAPANEITAGTAASFNVDPTRLGNNTIYVTAPGGTFILTSEYATPAGCATKNDTLVINFLPVPDLAVVADTICQAAGESVDLATLATDNNGTTGTTAWYPTLSDAQAETNALASTTVSPASTTKYYIRKNTTATDATSAPCYDIDSVSIEVRCLNLGNYVWYDTDNDGTIDGGESPIENVTVQLFLDADENGSLDGAEQTPIDTDVTDASGLYLFENLAPGKYFVGIPGSEFNTGETLENLYSSGTTAGATGVTSETTAPDPDGTVLDTDDNGMEVKTGFYTGGIMTTASVMLMFQDEPTGESPDNSSIDDLDDNLTVDFGFYGMSLGSLVFMDTDNTGTFDNADMGISGVPVTLYASDGTTVVGTTTTDADGQYLFTGLAAGTYIVAVDTTASALDGKLSSDDIASSSTPTSADNDDNGVVFNSTEARSNPVTLTPGSASTGEGDQGETATGMSNPTVTDNPLVPDNGSELHVDFGFKPVCPTIDNPQGAQTICANDAGTDLSVDISVDSTVAFVRFDDPQTGNAMYSGGTQIGSDVDPTGSSDPFTATYTFNTADFPNASNTTPDTFYVYGIFANPPSDATCRPYAEIQVIVNPNPTATAASLTLCETILGGGTSDFDLTVADSDVLNGQTGMTVTYHNDQADADANANAITGSFTSASGTIVARVTNTYGCYATANITLTVNDKPDFTLSLPTTCPGDEPTVLLNNLINGDAILSLMDLNGGGFAPYQANTVFTTADGLNLNATNTVTIRNQNGCETAKPIAVPDITPLVCPPVNVNVIRTGE